jgi:DNA polymerase III alpha subunit
MTDLTGSIEAVVFPKNYKEWSTIIIPDAIIAIGGRVSLRNDEKSIIIEAVKALS